MAPNMFKGYNGKRAIRVSHSAPIQREGQPMKKPRLTNDGRSEVTPTVQVNKPAQNSKPEVTKSSKLTDILPPSTERQTGRRLFDISSTSSSSKSTTSKKSSKDSLVSPDVSVHAEKSGQKVFEKEYQVASVSAPEYHPTDKKEIMLKGLEIQQKERIVLNVGGRCFESSRQTLQADPSSHLSVMTARDMCSSSNGTDDKTYILDRNPRYFDFILDYLRSSDYNYKLLPTDKCVLIQIHMETTYYGLPGLVHSIEEIEKGKYMPFTLWED